MDIASGAILRAAAPTGTPRLTVVTPQRGRGAMPTSEELKELLSAVATNGDRQAFAILFKHFAPRIVTYLMRGGTPGASAEELAQEAMVLVWRKAATFDPQLAGVSSWVYTIARNLRIDRHRRNRAADLEDSDDALIELVDHPDPAWSPEEQIGAMQRECRIRAALRELPWDQAQVLQLSFFSESPHSEIARTLDIPLGTVKSRIRRALINLRRLIDATPP